MSKSMVMSAINMNAGGDSIAAGVGRLEGEVRDAIYGHINTLYKLSAGPTAPATNVSLNDIWQDTSGDSPVLKYCSAVSPTIVFSQLGASGLFSSTISLDQGIKGYTRNMVLTRVIGGNQLEIAATVAAPATIEVGGVLLQAVSPVRCTFTGENLGVFACVVKRTAGTSTFEFLAPKAAPYTPQAGERIVGYAQFKVRGSGNRDFLWWSSLEAPTRAEMTAPEIFHGKATAATIVAGAAPVIIKFGTTVLDPHGVLDADVPADVDVFYCKRAGLYEFNASARFQNRPVDNLVDIAWMDGTIGLLVSTWNGASHDDEATARARSYLKLGAAAGANVSTLDLKVSCYLQLAVHDKVSVQIQQNNSANADQPLRIAQPFDTAFWGRYLGTN